MNLDKLYKLAFEYKKTKIWQKIYDNQIFAVKLSDGQISYISIMGAVNGHCALVQYIGDEGFDSLRKAFRPNVTLSGPFEQHEKFLQQNCLQCVFDCKDALSPEEYADVKSYARTNNIRLGGKNAYPIFKKYKPNCYPWYLQTDSDVEKLCQALSATIALSKMIEKSIPAPEEVGDYTKEFPMLELEKGKYIMKTTPMPKKNDVKYPKPKVLNDIASARLSGMKPNGVLECKIIRLMEPVQLAPNEMPIFPVVLLVVDELSKLLLQVDAVPIYEEKPDNLLNKFMETLINQGICPKKIKTCDKRTYSFAENFCKKFGISLTMEDELERLEEAEYDLYRFLTQNNSDDDNDLNDDELLDTINYVFSLDENQLRNLPNDILDSLRAIVASDVLPKDIAQALSERLNTKKKVEILDFTPKTHQSYVISVSLGTGRYRHIQISESSTLEQLHTAILSAFGFDNDHAYAFFMDDKIWSDNDCYFMSGMDDEHRVAEEYKLNQTSISVGKKFKYLFDFGDEWCFQCKVLRIEDGDTEIPAVIRSKGKAPEQYPKY